MTEKSRKSDEQWMRELTPEQYAICRLKGTEPPFTGRYWSTKTRGVYACACCGQDLFHSDAKYDSGSGWPSFWEPLATERVTTEMDGSHGTMRTEVLCSHCAAHLGHVFDDGPRPTGLRYCINSAALKLKPESDENA